MITFSLVYLLIYILVFLSLLILTCFGLPFIFLVKLSLPAYFTLLQRYTPSTLMLTLNFLFLTGLPPFGLFLVKFNILTVVLSCNHFIINFIIVFTFLLNMFYYSQIFNYKNYKNSSYTILNSNIFKLLPNSDKNIKKHTYLSYKIVLSRVNSILFVGLSIFFYSDLILLLNL